MKQRNEKPSESAMRFFTPELCLLLNSSDDDEANNAITLWEQAIQEYKEHLDSFRKDMPPQLQSLSDLNFHDAEILAVIPTQMVTQGNIDKRPHVYMVLRNEEEVILLIYSLWGHRRILPPNENWRFSRSQTNWLYDEMDQSQNHGGSFWHRILVSNGSVIGIPVQDVVILRDSEPSSFLIQAALL